ncbi:MAG: hypothetical protein Q3979_02765 [Actinomycetaceae bacterium]|nr:hypothetical protein [Actinomycetaceae bacterium]
MNTRPRRPAQLDDAQIEAIEGDADVAYNSELAHTSAQALVPMGRRFRETDRAAVARVLDLVDSEGVDVLAETWVRSPQDSLPGVLWRGYLLREWIRREGDDVAKRYQAVAEFLAARGGEEADSADIPKPGVLRQEWDRVFAGAYEGDFAELLDDSARFTGLLGRLEAVWIEADSHPLATAVTRRDSALLATSRELAAAGELFRQGRLE